MFLSKYNQLSKSLHGSIHHGCSMSKALRNDADETPTTKEHTEKSQHSCENAPLQSRPTAWFGDKHVNHYIFGISDIFLNGIVIGIIPPGCIFYSSTTKEWCGSVVARYIFRQDFLSCWERLACAYHRARSTDKWGCWVKQQYPGDETERRKVEAASTRSTSSSSLWVLHLLLRVIK